jgi:hypothetical protein
MPCVPSSDKVTCNAIVGLAVTHNLEGLLLAQYKCCTVAYLLDIRVVSDCVLLTGPTHAWRVIARKPRPRESTRAHLKLLDTLFVIVAAVHPILCETTCPMRPTVLVVSICVMLILLHCKGVPAACLVVTPAGKPVCCCVKNQDVG